MLPLQTTFGALLLLFLFTTSLSAQSEQQPSITKRVIVINIDPILEKQGGKRLNQHVGWNDPRSLTAGYLDDISAASGGYVKWELTHWVDLDLWPKKKGWLPVHGRYLSSVGIRLEEVPVASS